MTSCSSNLAFAILLTAIAIDNYGFTHVAWTGAFFVVASTYVVFFASFRKLVRIYGLLFAAFLLAWAARLNDVVASVLQLMTVGTLMALIALRVFHAFMHQLAGTVEPAGVVEPLRRASAS